MNVDLATQRARLARFDANTAAVLARLDAEAAYLEALAERLRDDESDTTDAVA